ncbi:MAG: Flp pilus assembly complex ATPase component TadA [Kofleriaceae bacterium]|nr:Flp pilus assembly complex ATPase component TadA [Kofleriaceae bacterium]
MGPPGPPGAAPLGAPPVAAAPPPVRRDAGVGVSLIGEILKSDAGLTQQHLNHALGKQAEDGGLLGAILVGMKAVNEVQLTRALALQYDEPFVEKLPAVNDVPEGLITNIPINFAKQHLLVPYGRDEDDRVLVALADPLALDVLDDVGVMLQSPVEPVMAPPAAITELINKMYGRLRQGADLSEDKENVDDGSDSEELVDILDLTDEAPIIRWVNSLLFQAVKERASDIHIEPGEKEVQVRYRVDGALRKSKTAPKQFLSSILARVKIMSGLNIAEKRLPQDGRIRRKIAGKDIDMRVATVPTAAGERVTIRLLDRSSVLLGLGDVGMSGPCLRSIRDIIKRPHGIMLVTGPTGSGKTTTLYACLSEINSPELNILMIEDPVEYQLEGISQTQVQSKIDLTFAAGLRSFLRHDPDVIMIGEIRDQETAEIAITASLTGHFVLSTIHTNDAAGAITRLTDMNIEPFLVASSMVGLMAQRLVRKPCPECSVMVEPSVEILKQLDLDPERFFAGDYGVPDVPNAKPLPLGKILSARGCPMCNNLGYRGRTGIYEMLVVDDAIRQLTLAKADASRIRAAAIEAGMSSLRMDGALKVLGGLTTAEEVLLTTAEGDI